MATHIFIKNLQNVCLVNIHTFWYIDMPYMTASYETPFDIIAFFWVFSYIFDVSCLNCCISTKLLLVVYLINSDVKMSDVTVSYGMFLNFITFFCIFLHNWRIFMSEVLYLYQIFMRYVFDVNITNYMLNLNNFSITRPI